MRLDLRIAAAAAALAAAFMPAAAADLPRHLMLARELVEHVQGLGRGTIRISTDAIGRPAAS